MFRQDFTCPALLDGKERNYRYGAVTLCGAPSQALLVLSNLTNGLVRVRSPLLTESRLMSFPPGTEMFQFPGFASTPYVFRRRYRQSGGFPHSDIHGSKDARSSPRLFAACHVFHRLSVPRHPPDALKTLDRSASLVNKNHAREQNPNATENADAAILVKALSSLHDVQKNDT
jgi:hypothetical protein